jgi:hypothetical protein
MRRLVVLVATALALSAAAPARAESELGCGEGTTYNAMWYSILHPGLGEWYLKDWGPMYKAPQKKFWLGFIPLYGWPGYLQVKSAIDARHCETNDYL